MNKQAKLMLFLATLFSAFEAQSQCHKPIGGTKIDQANINWDTVQYAMIAFDYAETIIPISNQFKSVRTLCFVACDANSILFKMAFLPTVNYICMNRIELDSWPLAIEKYSHLTCIDLAGNNIKSLPPNLNFPNLQYLSLGDGAYGGNQLTFIGDNICSVTSLKELVFYQNPIDSISASIVKLQNLKVLNLNQTELKSLPGFLGELTNLQELYLSNLEIETFPVELTNCKNFSKVSFNNCLSLDLEQALDVLAQMPNLTELDLSLTAAENHIEAIAQLKSLEMLDVSNTNLSYSDLEVILKKCKNLKIVKAVIKGLSVKDQNKLKSKYKDVEFKFTWF